MLLHPGSPTGLVAGDIPALKLVASRWGRFGSAVCDSVTAFERPVIGQVPAIACRTAATTTSGRWFWM